MRFAPKEEIRDSYRKGLKEEKPISESLNRPLDGREMALEPLSLRTEENNHRNEETRRGMLIRAGSFLTLILPISYYPLAFSSRNGAFKS